VGSSRSSFTRVPMPTHNHTRTLPSSQSFWQSIAPLFGKDIPGSKDHPLLKRFEGSEIIRYKAAPFDALDFYKKDKAKTSFEGQMVRVLFKEPAGKSSSLEVFRNYENELKEKGWELAYSGPSEFDGYGVLAPPESSCTGLDPKNTLLKAQLLGRILVRCRRSSLS
jgi:hypothetical protein